MDLVRFADPFWLVCLIFMALPWIARRRRWRLPWPTLDGFQRSRATWPLRFAWLPALARSLAIGCMVVGLARPQSIGEQIRIASRGVAIALVVDRSSSMKSEDFPALDRSISRLEAAKRTLASFLAARGDDLIGVVAFANFPDTIAPPTLDRRFTWGAIQAVRPAGAGDDGTDIGGAIAWGLGMVRPTPARRKVLILVTDGHHAPGSTDSLDPIVAAEVARGLGVTLHTVAIGRPPEPVAPAPGRVPPAGEGPDVELLRELAKRGNGRAFVATDAEALTAIFEEIDALETSPIEGTIRTVYRDRYAPWVVAALGLVAVDLALSSGRWRRLP